MTEQFLGKIKITEDELGNLFKQRQGFKTIVSPSESKAIQEIGFIYNVRWLDFEDSTTKSGKSVRNTDIKYLYYNAGTHSFSAKDDDNYFINLPWRYIEVDFVLEMGIL